MALHIKNREVGEPAAQVASAADETKTEAVRRALEERKVRLQAHGMTPNRDRRKYLEERVRPFTPPEAMGTGVTKQVVGLWPGRLAGTILDASAIISILIQEPGADALSRKIGDAHFVGVGAPSMFETALALSNKRGIDAFATA